jgi:hypothetical protein
MKSRAIGNGGVYVEDAERFLRGREPPLRQAPAAGRERGS